MEIYLAALTWILISVLVAIVVGTVIKFGSSGLPIAAPSGPSAAASRRFRTRRATHEGFILK